MERTVEQRVADEMNERPKVVFIEGKEFKVKPLTLGQLIDIAAEISQIGDVCQEDEGKDLLSVTLEHVGDLEHMLNIALVVMFRNPEDRELNRDFIRRNLDERVITELQEMYTERLNTPFFLTNIIFLKRALNLTKPTRMTVRGRSGTEQ